MREAAAGFQKNTNEVKKIMWWQNLKVKIAIIVIAVLLLGMAIALIAVYASKK